MSFKIETIPQAYLSVALKSTDTEMYLKSVKGWDGGSISASGEIYAVIMDKNKSRMEIVELDGSTINNTAITINKRGLPYSVDVSSKELTEVSDNKQNWSAGDLVYLGTNAPQLFSMLARLHNGGELPGDYTFSGDSTITGKWTFPASGGANSVLLGSSYTEPVNDLEIAPKKYADAIATAGSPDANVTTKGVVEIATSSEIDAGTMTGSSGAYLAITPDELENSVY